ncbi:Ig-like domain-containing protein [Myxococcota bacterium]|nr:Ig-like domain-containing protein [Myxococcota bacterium]
MKRRPSITLGARALLGAALALACACGNADLIAPEPLAVADTSPSNGALVAAGDTPIVVTFTDDVDEATLDASVTLDETSPAGLPIASVPLTRESYADATYTVPTSSARSRPHPDPRDRSSPGRRGTTRRSDPEHR